MAGGYNEQEGYLSEAYVFSWLEQVWTQLASLTDGRYVVKGCGAVTNGDAVEDVVMVTHEGALAQQSEIYNVAEDNWRPGPAYPEPDAIRVTAVQDGEGSFYVLGGKERIEVDALKLDTVYRFDSDTYEYVLLDTRIPFAANDVAALFTTGDII